MQLTAPLKEGLFLLPLKFRCYTLRHEESLMVFAPDNWSPAA